MNYLNDSIRVQAELARLHRLVELSGGRLGIRSEHGGMTIVVSFLGVRAPVWAAGGGWEIAEQHALTLTLLDTFPESKPALMFSRALAVVNCARTGWPCLLEYSWHANMHLDQVVSDALDLMQGVSFNADSAADMEARALWLDPLESARLRTAIGEPWRLRMATMPVTPPGLRLAPRSAPAPGLRLVPAGAPVASRGPRLSAATPAGSGAPVPPRAGVRLGTTPALRLADRDR